MIAPALAAWRFAVACLYGLGLGTVYSFLRPVRPRALADAVFVAALFYGWVQLSFGICKGDIRIGYTAGLFVGIFLWELTAGKWLRPVFSGFWKGIGRCFRVLLYPGKKIFEKMRLFMKFVFASWKKWVTIKWNNRRYARRKTGGPHGKHQKTSRIRKTGIQKNSDTDKDRCVGGRCTVYGGTSGSPWRH